MPHASCRTGDRVLGPRGFGRVGLLAAFLLALSGCIEEPLVIDGDVGATTQAVSTTLNATQDTTIINVVTSNSNGASLNLWAGTDNQATARTRRVLVQFNVSSLANSTINSASLRMTVTKVPAPVAPAVPANSWFDAYRVTQQWWEGSSNGAANGLDCFAGGYGATWNSAYCTAGYSWAAGGSVAASYSGSWFSDTTLGQKTWTGSGLAADVQAWANGTQPNYGWLVRSYSEGTKLTTRQFGSINGGTPAQLVVDFTCNAGRSWMTMLVSSR